MKASLCIQAPTIKNLGEFLDTIIEDMGGIWFSPENVFPKLEQTLSLRGMYVWVCEKRPLKKDKSFIRRRRFYETNLPYHLIGRLVLPTKKEDVWDYLDYITVSYPKRIESPQKVALLDRDGKETTMIDIIPKDGVKTVAQTYLEFNKSGLKELVFA
jgi:hypothetical protein